MPGYATVNPMYQPAMRLITDISNATEALVTTSFDHDYLPGLVVRIYVPPLYGMVQAYQLQGTVLTVPTGDTFTVDIDTSFFDVFAAPVEEPWYNFEYPMVVPMGEVNETLDQATRNIL